MYCGKQSVGSCSAGETECTCGSGGGCPTNPTNGICCKPAGPCTAGPYALIEWDPVNNDITCPSGQIRMEPPSSYTQTRSCKDASGNTADASCCGATLSQNATYYSSCESAPPTRKWRCINMGEDASEAACNQLTCGSRPQNGQACDAGEPSFACFPNYPTSGCCGDPHLTCMDATTVCDCVLSP